jgi:diguanylate cyclase (GGDEF)-like protein
MGRGMTRSVRLVAFGRGLRHQPKTIALWLTPALLAATVWFTVVPDVPGLGPVGSLVALFVGFLVADRVSLQVEIQRQTYAISPTEIPLVVGLFLVNPVGLLLIRVAACFSLLLDRRRLRGKLLFNAGVYATEVGVAEAIVRASGNATVTHPGSWGLALAAVAFADLAGSTLVSVAIVVTTGRMDRRRLLSVILPTMIAGLVSATVGLIVLLVLQVNELGVVLFVGLAVVFTVGYKAYGRFLRQHESLGQTYEFSKYVERARSDPSVLGHALAHAREMLNAGSAVLWTRASERVDPVLVSVDANGTIQTLVVPSVNGVDPVRAAAMQSRRSRRFTARELGEGPVRVELELRGVAELIVAPLRTGERVLGTLELADRQGQLASFTPDDMRVLETLATHLTAAIENQQLLERLRHAAYHDRLTDLPNRARLAQVLDEAIPAAMTGGSVVVLCQLDVDRFKDVNDSLGHAWGDQLLVQLGERIVTSAPEGSVVARVGADEFAVLTTVADLDRAERVGRELRRAVSTIYPLAGLTIDISVSVGVALAPEHAPNADTLMRRVDVALSTTKHTGRPVSLYDPSMDQASLHRLRLVTQLREALDSGQVVVRYQPKIALRTRELIGAEALVRWNHPEFGEVMPDEFVPLAEVTGLIGPLTMHVLRSAVRQCRQWLDRDMRIGVAVNLSARSLVDADFPERVANVLAEHRVPADLLTFELTENSVMTDPDRMKPVLHRLHALGVGLSIDDFGIGYSSLAQLRRLPVDEVKIDKVFVFGMGTDLGDLAIVRAIIELGHSLGLRVVAEGVEDELARDLLLGNECDVIQGYLVSRALDPDRFDAWLAARTSPRPAQPGVHGRRVQLVS